jgi:tetratricopeptide (TPR) repeat protein
MALQRLAIEGTGVAEGERFASWSALASHPSATDAQRAQAFLHMGLLRRREGRLAEAVELFRKAPWSGGPDATTAGLMAGHALFEQGDYASALAAYREAEDKGSGEASRFALYQGMCLEHLGRVREAVGEYAAALLDAPLWWRRPLAWHLVELYDAAGRPDVLATFLDAQGADAYASTLPVRRVMFAYRLEKNRDWRSLVTHLARADSSDPRDPRKDSIGPVIVRVLARHCEEVAPLLPSVAPNEPSSSIGHVRELCGLGGDAVDVVVRAREAAEVGTPELPFPPVARVELPAPIVSAQHKVRRPHLLY